MDFSLTEEQELLLASIRELITTNFPEEYFRTCDQNGTYPREFMRALADNGISMLGVPEEFGGIPADYVTQMLALMEVSKCGASAFLITNGQCIHSMRRFGSAEQLRKTAESTLETGDPAYALALTNQVLAQITTVPLPLTRVNGKVYINGQKTFITGAKEYPYMLVLARDPQPKIQKAFTLWWVDSSKPGIKINPLHKSAGICSAPAKSISTMLKKERHGGRRRNGFPQCDVELRDGAPDQRRAQHRLCRMRL